MTNINRIVHRILDRNPSIVKSIQEGIVNRRALAYRIIKKYNIPGSVYAVMSAIRRYEPEWDKEEDLRQAILKNSKLSTKSRLVMIEIDRKFSILADFLRETHRLLDPSRGDVLRIMEGRKYVKAIVDLAKKDEVVSLLNESDILQTRENLGEINIQLGGKGKKGILAGILHELAIHNIPVEECLSCLPEFVIILDDRFIGKAHDVLIEYFNSERANENLYK